MAKAGISARLRVMIKISFTFKFSIRAKTRISYRVI